MSGPGHDHSAEPAAPASGPAIVLTFTGPGEAGFTVAAADVSPAQLYAAAWFLDQLAREVRQGIVTREAMGELTTAPASFLDALRRAGNG